MLSEEIVKELELARGNPGRLEELFRRMAPDEQVIFKQAVTDCAVRFPDDVLYHAWELRLQARGEKATIVEAWVPYDKTWTVAIGFSIALGLLFMFAAGGKPPVPVAEIQGSYFWLFWPGLLGFALMLFFAATCPQYVDARQALLGIGLMIAFTAVAGIHSLSGPPEDTTTLVSLHLPIAVWAMFGAVYMKNMRYRTAQVFAFIRKSVAVCITAGLYYAAGGIFVALTIGIFNVLGIQIPEEVLIRFAAWGVGTIPLLALVSIYDPQREPIDQSQHQGIESILSFITSLFLPLALAVLAAYVLWFIPAHFWEPFKSREVLMVYNATIMALLALLVLLPREDRGMALQRWIRRGVMGTAAFTLLLNLYAFAAVLTRTLQWGITPNRHAVLGWNVVTFIMLGMIFVDLLSARDDNWVARFKSTVAKAMIFPVAWSVWLLFVTPIIA